MTLLLTAEIWALTSQRQSQEITMLIFYTSYLYQGCEVHAYDPTVDLSNEKIDFHFHKTGLSHKDTLRDRTLGRIIHDNGHKSRRITMIKMDVEGAERLGIDVWLNEGALENVQQFALEYHLTNGKIFRRFMLTYASFF